MLAALIVLGETEEKDKEKRCWVRPLYATREEYGLKLLFKDIRQDPAGFTNFLRVRPSEFEELLTMIGPTIGRQDTNMRKAVTIQDRLGITLRFLAAGETFSSLRFISRISKQALSYIVPEITAALYDALQGMGVSRGGQGGQLPPSSSD